jgi:hypothetical protein
MPGNPRPLAAAAVLISLFALCGCGRTVWYKPGASELNFGEERGDCIQRAYAEFPVALAQAPLLGTPSDSNDEARDAAIGYCLQTKGWTLKEEPGTLSAVPDPDPPDTATR